MPEAKAGGDDALLELRDLKTHFFTDEGVAKAVDGVSYVVKRGETLGVVGESGCGKSVTALSVMKLIPDPPGRIVAGSIWFEGRDLAALSTEEMRRIRGNEIGMIFQEPMTSLNPVFTVGDQIIEAVVLHRGVPYEEGRARAVEMLRLVGIPSPESRVDDYPHQMSGGMRQRVMIAMALSCDPKLLIADEPTTALDVTIQAQILDLMNRLQRELGMSILLITHDLGVVAQNAHHVAVMYAGKVVEYSDVREVFGNPRHPYTVGLFRSIPKLGAKVAKLDTIPGTVPSALEFPAGCRFHNRCPFATARCSAEEPELRALSPGHTVACHFAEEVTLAEWEKRSAAGLAAAAGGEA
ncbi:MAG: ABC transporter ATP-binding protein [Planctomycetaceae bacterium]|nr:ABC transporter ATP-binding protein [Planctomycetota bacterium]NUN51380.1 ABC transporter ATP-binding protein [Planctomycetaceae bacterium]